MKTADLIAMVEAMADSVKCTAHVIDNGRDFTNFCISPHDEHARWAGDLRIHWSREAIAVTLEHSGPIGRRTVDNTEAGREDLMQWLAIELED